MAKRVELYLTFKCNNDCLFCLEKANRQRYKDEDVFKSKTEIEQKLGQYKEQGYNHLNLLGGEPFLAEEILTVLTLAKQLNFTVALATNGSILSQEKIARSCLPLIDDLIVSIHGHNKELINPLSQNNLLYDQLLAGLKNIKKYFHGRLLKVNCVVNTLNYQKLLAILQFIKPYGFKEINFTSLDLRSYNKELALDFALLTPQLAEAISYANKEDIIVRFADFPLCVLAENYHLANHLYFDEREKFYLDGARDEQFGRPKIKPAVCATCSQQDLCQGLDQSYYEIFGADCLKPLSL